MQEFEFIPQSTENIFFVAHSHAENPHESLILAGFCFFIIYDQRSAKSHFDAQIEHHFPICSVLFATFPSGTSSKEHQTIIWFAIFYLFLDINENKRFVERLNATLLFDQVDNTILFKIILHFFENRMASRFV